MKDAEDEAFDDLAKRQGAWGGGYDAKRKAAMDKINADFDEEYIKMHEDRIKYGTSWEKDGKRIDPMSVYKEPVTEREALKLAVDGLEKILYSFEKDGKFVMKSMIRNELFAEINLLSKKAKKAFAQPAQEPEMLTIAYQSGYHDGKQVALAGREWNFCERCGKRTKDLTVIHTCTPPQEGK